MDILISNLLFKSIFYFGKWSNWKCTNTRICVLSVWGGGATIRISQEIHCLPYAGFFYSICWTNILVSIVPFAIKLQCWENAYINKPLFNDSFL